MGTKGGVIMAGYKTCYLTEASCPNCDNDFEQHSLEPAEYIMCPKCFCVFDKDGDIKYVMEDDESC